MSSWDRRVKAFSSKGAAELLEREGGVENLVFTSATPLMDRLRRRTQGPPADDAEEDQGANDDLDDDERLCFHRFVTALQRDRTAREISFENQDFGGGPPPVDEPTARTCRRESDVRRLFGEVLPNHPALRSLGFTTCRIPSSALLALLSALPSSAASRLSGLKISYVPIRTEGVRAVARLLRQDFPLEVLLLQGWNGGGQGDATGGVFGGIPPEFSSSSSSWDGAADDDDDVADACRVLCDAAADASIRRMRRLLLGEVAIGPDTARRALGRESGLRDLCVRGSWTGACFREALRQLRTNEVMETFYMMLPCGAPRARDFPCGMMVELLSTYNCTLRSFHTYDLGMDAANEARVVELLRLNALVRLVRDRLREKSYAVANKALWPRVLERVARFPALVYRFVRIGNAPALAEHLGSAKAGTKRRGRFGPDEPRGSAIGPHSE